MTAFLNPFSEVAEPLCRSLWSGFLLAGVPLPSWHAASPPQEDLLCAGRCAKAAQRSHRHLAESCCLTCFRRRGSEGVAFCCASDVRQLSCSSRRSWLRLALAARRGREECREASRIKTDSRAYAVPCRRPVLCDRPTQTRGDERTPSIPYQSVVAFLIACDDSHYLGHLRSARRMRGTVRCNT